MRHKQRERGQVVLLVLVAMSLFLLAALGLAIDGANLYHQRQMAQTAADAAAQAGMISIFNGSNTSGAASFTATVGSNWTCVNGSDPRTPCEYARRNGAGNTAIDTVLIEFPPAAEYPGVTLSTVDPVNLVRATVTRRVDTTLMRLLGSNFTMVAAKGTAAIVDIMAPVPILVTHPDQDGSFAINGNPLVTICGGPGRSIQVNSSSTTSIVIKGNPTVDLSKAGPKDDINNPCTTGTGADFGDVGGPATYPGPLLLGSTGRYLQPTLEIKDPLWFVDPPTTAGLPTDPPPTPLADGVGGCPALPKKACNLYQPGVYTSGIDVKNETAVFAPGVYYMQGGNGFQSTANGHMVMCAVGYCTGGGATGNGMLVYNSGGGPFNVGANGDVDLLGTPDGSPYYGILFFQDRGAATTEHRLGGGGGLKLTGTIYLTNTLSDQTSPVDPYQTLHLQGTPGSTTLVIGQIIVSILELGGNAGITMQLDPEAKLHVRQIALVK